MAAGSMHSIEASIHAIVDQPEATQRAVLDALVASNDASAYGRDHDFAGCTSYERFAERVPVVTYDALAPYVSRILAGERGVLIAEEIVYLATSSGTTGRKKYIPIHRGFAQETDRWMALERYFLERAHPEVRGKPELRYVNRVEEPLPSGLPTGSVSGWFYGELARAGRYDEIVPYALYQLPSVLGRNYGVLRFALARSIAQMSAVNPSTLLLLAQRLEADGQALVRDVRDGELRHDEIPRALAEQLRSGLHPDPTRAAALDAAIATAGGRLTPRGAWPELALLSCWVHAGASLYRDDLARVFGPGPVTVWDYGYTSSEGRVTVTYDDTGCGLPLFTSVFLELRLDDRATLPLFAARDGQEGELVVTNSRGLYRYAMGDVVRVSGRCGQAPLLSFVRKTTAVGSLTGEKLTEDQVVRVVNLALSEAGLAARFFCLAPSWGTPPRYLLLLETDGRPLDDAEGRALIGRVERALAAANAEYERKRQTLRLAPLGLLLLEPGELDRYVARLVAGGREPARLKTPRVTMDLELAKTFRGRLVEQEGVGGAATATEGARTEAASTTPR
jgi:hypothetical protein